MFANYLCFLKIIIHSWKEARYLLTVKEARFLSFLFCIFVEAALGSECTK